MRGSTTLALFVCCAAHLGCADDVPSASPVDAASPDVTVDVTVDLPSPTDVPVDVAPTDVAPVDTGPVRCVSGADCTHDPRGPACDTATGACAPCAARDDRCPDGQYCVEGMNRCAPGCRDDAACTAPAADGGVARSRCDITTRACVECLASDDCPVGSRCEGHVCAMGCDATSRCPPRQQCCSGACVDIDMNPAHCGRCDRSCASPHAEVACGGAACRIERCVEPYRDCDGSAPNGCEADTRTSLTHCGGCGMPCAPREHATTTCEMGACVYRCDEGYADCDGNTANGCEADTRTSSSNCGACGRACGVPFGTGACRAGVCGIERCESGRADCNADLADGCETVTAVTLSHCGACGNACRAGAHAAATCSDGRCASSCVSGYGDCDADMVNGCESTLDTDVRNCGGCGLACTVDHGAAACASGRCAVGACEAGYGDCNGNARDGCEQPLNTLAHCGVCGRACPPAMGGVSACTAGRCALQCDPHRADCDGDVGNGCEVDLATDPRNCGACGVAPDELCDATDNNCNGQVDEGYTFRGCVSLVCTGTGRVGTISDGCVDDGGGSAAGDELEIYCVNGITRFCLSGEACPWRSGASTADDVTCSRAGLASDFMATASCSRWNGQSNYQCDPAGRVYFP